jgi:hypothetical protein
LPFPFPAGTRNVEGSTFTRNVSGSSTPVTFLLFAMRLSSRFSSCAVASAVSDADGLRLSNSVRIATNVRSGTATCLTWGTCTRDAPPEIELGRALAIARAGVLPDRVSLGLQLLLASIQRRRAVIGANRWRFKSYAETPDKEAWFVPPYYRKSGSKRGNRSHLVPLVGWGAEAVRKLDRLSDSVDGPGWLFPGRRTRGMISEGVPAGHADVGLLNNYLSVLPGVDFSPQFVRYAFSTYGERDLGFRKSEAKVILDHMEGTEPDDVTGKFYSSDPAIGRKREMITLWAGRLDEWCAKAIAAGPVLSDREALVEAIYRQRYSEKQLARRIEYRSRRDRPLWNHLRRVEDIDAAE